MSLTKLSPWPEIISLLPARERLVRDIPAGDGIIADLFFQCRNCLSAKGLGAPPVQAFLPVCIHQPTQRVSNYMYILLWTDVNGLLECLTPVLEPSSDLAIITQLAEKALLGTYFILIFLLSARALLDMDLIWFGYIAILS
jgi:hypothetical protein